MLVSALCASHAGQCITANKRLTLVNQLLTLSSMVKSFKHKGLEELFATGKSRKVKPAFLPGSIRLMDALDASTVPEDMNIPGFKFHGIEWKAKTIQRKNKRQLSIDLQLGRHRCHKTRFGRLPLID